MLFKEYSTIDESRQYTSVFSMGSNDSDVFFFGDSNDGGRYFFKCDKEDNRVFYQNSKNLYSVEIWESFNHLILDKLNQQIIRNL